MIKVNDQFRLVVDGRRIILQEAHETKSKEIAWENAAYYPSWQAAMVGVLRREMAIPGEIADLCERLDRFEKLIRGFDDQDFDRCVQNIKTVDRM